MHDAEKLKMELSKWFDVDRGLSRVWQVGSRHVQDVAQLKRIFPDTEFHLFEPNPDAYVDLANMASKLGDAHAHNRALGVKSGLQLFNKMDRDHAGRPWEDEQQAPTLFVMAAKGYRRELQIQTSINVRVETAESFCEKEEIETPDLIWMDVQGHEGHVISGFGDSLSEVSALYVEISLVDNLESQLLISEFIKVVTCDFLWVAAVNTEKWHVGCVFINRRYSNLKMRLIHRALKLNLRYGWGPGIANLQDRELILRILKLPLILLYNFLVGRRWGGPLAANFLRLLPTRLISGQIGHALRTIYDQSLPNDDLKYVGNLPKIEVVIPCLKKDLITAMECVKSLKPNSHNEISKITLVVPEADLKFLDPLAGEVTIRLEESLIPDALRAALARFPQERRGWLTQQIIKLSMVRESQAAGVLVIDADTVLTHPRVWLDASGKQNLSISNEFHLPYVRHYSKVFSQAGHFRGLSFVTHHQLMQPAIVREMLPTTAFVVDWIDKVEDYESGASEYHDYGTFLLSRYPQLVSLSRWANLSAPPQYSASGVKEFLTWVSHTKPETMSVSFHSYNGNVLPDSE